MNRRITGDTKEEVAIKILDMMVKAAKSGDRCSYELTSLTENSKGKEHWFTATLYEENFGPEPEIVHYEWKNCEMTAVKSNFEEDFWSGYFSSNGKPVMHLTWASKPTFEGFKAMAEREQ